MILTKLIEPPPVKPDPAVFAAEIILKAPGISQQMERDSALYRTVTHINYISKVFADKKKKKKRQNPHTPQKTISSKKRIIGIALIYFNAFRHQVINQEFGRMGRKKK